VASDTAFDGCKLTQRIQSSIESIGLNESFLISPIIPKPREYTAGSEFLLREKGKHRNERNVKVAEWNIILRNENTEQNLKR
jgi:hypothetical protein